MKKKTSGPVKIETLKRHGTLNPYPKRVRDPLFREEEFFDPHDLLQVKYEMLRRVQKEKESVTEAADAFGFSRLSFYRTQAVFAERGLTGLIPQRRGPKEAHKLSAEVVRFMREALGEDPSLRAIDLKPRLQERFGIEVHPRSIERALDRKKRGKR